MGNGKPASSLHSQRRSSACQVDPQSTGSVSLGSYTNWLIDIGGIAAAAGTSDGVCLVIAPKTA